MKLYTLYGEPIPELTLPVIPIDELLAATIAFTAFKFEDFDACFSNMFDGDDAYEELIDCDSDYDTFHYAPWLVDNKTHAKWEVTYLMHELSNYNDILRAVVGDLYYYEIKDIVKRELFEKISKVYPHLKEECERRIGKLDEDDENVHCGIFKSQDKRTWFIVLE